MHHTNRVRRPAVWCWLLALTVCGTWNLGQTYAQQPPPQRLVIPVGETKTLTMPPGALFKDAKVPQPGVIRVTPSPDARTIFVTGENPGITPLIVEDSKGGRQEFEIVVQTNIEYLKYLLKRAVPTANVDPVPIGNNRVILTGTVAKAEDIPIVLTTAQSALSGEFVNAMRVGGDVQVQLCVVIARVSRSEARRWSFSFFLNNPNWTLGSILTPGNYANTATFGTAGAVGALAEPVNNIVLGVNGATTFFGFLQALRVEGLAKFMAEPRLVTMSGKPASFHSGGRLAIPEPSGLGTNAVRFEDFGTELTFLPIVLGSKIYLEVEPVVNTRNDANGTSIQGTVVPGFDTQRLHTAVELEDGQTLVIGGLIQNTVNAGTTKVPVLGDLPFLSPLFSTKTYTAVEDELLIIVTPHLVDASTCEQLPKYLPGQETRIPDDFELFLEGILEAPRGQREIFPGGKYMPAYKNGPSAATFPCGNFGGGCGHNGHCGAAGCNSSAPEVYVGSHVQAPVMPAPVMQTPVMPAGFSNQVPVAETSQPAASLPGTTDAPAPGPGNDMAPVPALPTGGTDGPR